MLALNEKPGFRRSYSYVTVEKYLKETVQVDPNLYDAYAGEYAPDPEMLREYGLPPGLVVTIKRAGDRLISEMRDMQDELLPESETVFFTEMHYGRMEFFKDGEGQVTDLIYREPGFEVRANKLR
ncbi:MAG TPA: hypothetical protein VFD58_10335 [Blastocatellia bacterium]|nr:hypothetical protein [Blastocatellia bacterium]